MENESKQGNISSRIEPPRIHTERVKTYIEKCKTHRRVIAAVFAKVWRRFFRYFCCICCKSAIVPLSACILSGSDSVDGGCWVNLMRETLIFGDEEDARALIVCGFVICAREPSVDDLESEWRPLFSSSSSSLIWGKVSMWFWHIRAAVLCDCGWTRIWIWLKDAVEVDDDDDNEEVADADEDEVV